MPKSKEELNALKEKYKEVIKEVSELTPEELEQVTGGVKILTPDPFITRPSA